ncbi:low-affinity phosphate transporter [Chytridiales sp. JEL 0842]|nr:low-affinity phosphate transporter [Chytridiales sp. JEL 0842]
MLQTVRIGEGEHGAGVGVSLGDGELAQKLEEGGGREEVAAACCGFAFLVQRQMESIQGRELVEHDADLPAGDSKDCTLKTFGDSRDLPKGRPRDTHFPKTLLRTGDASTTAMSYYDTYEKPSPAARQPFYTSDRQTLVEVCCMVEEQIKTLGVNMRNEFTKEVLFLRKQNNIINEKYELLLEAYEELHLRVRDLEARQTREQNGTGKTELKERVNKERQTSEITTEVADQAPAAAPPGSIFEVSDSTVTLLEEVNNAETRLNASIRELENGELPTASTDFQGHPASFLKSVTMSMLSNPLQTIGNARKLVANPSKIMDAYGAFRNTIRNSVGTNNETKSIFTTSRQSNKKTLTKHTSTLAPATFEDLPEQVVQRILSFLVDRDSESYGDLWRLRHVNKSIRRIAKSVIRKGGVRQQATLKFSTRSCHENKHQFKISQNPLNFFVSSENLRMQEPSQTLVVFQGVKDEAPQSELVVEWMSPPEDWFVNTVTGTFEVDVTLMGVTRRAQLKIALQDSEVQVCEVDISKKGDGSQMIGIKYRVKGGLADQMAANPQWESKMTTVRGAAGFLARKALGLGMKMTGLYWRDNGSKDELFRFKNWFLGQSRVHLRAVVHIEGVVVPNNIFAYSNLKKWVYLVEKAKLGLVTLPASYKEVDPNLFVQSAVAPSPRPPPVALDEESPLLGGMHPNAPSQAYLEAFFREALDDQLDKILQFYQKKENELLQDVDNLLGDITMYEGFDTRRGVNAEASGSSASASQPSGLRVEISSGSARTQSEGGILPTSRTPKKRPTILSPGTATGGLSPTSPTRNVSINTVSYGFWGRSEHKSQRTKFKKQITGLFVALSELDDYRELNHTGFSKILKKFEKVTGFKLKSSYMHQVNSSYPFTPEAAGLLKSEVDCVINLYARVITDNNLAQAATELKSSLREHIVWERNTIWRDMVSQERRTGSLGVRRKDIVGEQVPSTLTFNVFGLEIPMHPLINEKLAYFIVFTCLFAVLVNFPILETPEQQNCLAILIYASLLWAFEVLPLFVTSLMIPLLVVMLRVMREVVTFPDGHVEYHRMEAKPAAKKVFSDMFSPVIMLLLGGFSLAAALSKYNIAKGMASVVLGKAGSNPKYVVLANMFVSTFASMWISNVAAPVLCFSLVAPILRNLPTKSPYAKCIIIGIALAANVGGMASPIASPQNIIAMGTMNPPASWPEWFAIAIPVCIVIDIAIWLLLLAVYQPGASGHIDPPEAFQTNYFADNPLTSTHYYILFITFMTIILWCIEGLIEPIVGDMGVIAIFPLVAFYGTGILSKDDWNTQLWTVVMLAMGGISLGKAVDSSGLLASLTLEITPHLAGLSPFMCLVLFSGVVLVVTTFISHTVGALIILPVVAQIGASLPDPQPRMLIMAVALMCSGAMGLPVSSFPNMNAISLEDPTGEPWLEVLDFLKVGLLSSVFAWCAILAKDLGTYTSQMGVWSNFLTSLGLMKRKVTILMVGLDNSGKTTILNGLKLDATAPLEITPTVGFKVETFTRSRLQFTAFDMSGQGKYRDLWEHYYPDAEGIVFVVDATDKMRACVARDELAMMLGHPVLKERKVPILFLANKMDIPGSMTPSECSVALALEEIKDRNWTIFATNGLTGQGVNVGLDWLAEELS